MEQTFSSILWTSNLPVMFSASGGVPSIRLGDRDFHSNQLYLFTALTWPL